MLDPLVVYAIPLRPNDGSVDWKMVEENLKHSIASLKCQSDTNYRVMICGHDEPNIQYDDKVAWIKADFERPKTHGEGSLDKTRKRKAILQNAKEQYPAGFYFFILDADDLLHRDVNAYVRSHDNRVGYYLPSGYVYNVSDNAIAEMAGSSGRYFYKSCGSCAVFWFDHNDLYLEDVGMSPKFKILTKHSQIPLLAEQQGLAIEGIPFFAGLYKVNHGGNLSKQQGKSKVQEMHANNNAIVNEEEVSKIFSLFGGVF
ncbi:glycosyltransferase family A protein [Halomonas sp. BM-2019]|uniref:glycosyltransferase family A protein n=1 Tax=Halomonas sp. BM-2019 TaxID=2811227 RepID=UPI001B3C4A9A|nr:MAG: glycosyltransferase family 2 protein [Halomonas sp. BM-2019]